MDSALLRLLAMRMRGGIRQRLMQLASLRGVMFVLVLGGIAWLLISTGQLVPDRQVFGGQAFDSPALRDQIDTFMPLVMLAMTLLTVLISTGPSFHFSPTEINFLFVGPFSRRDLILYKFIAYATGAGLSAALIAPFAQSEASSILATFLATFLTLVFVQLKSAAVGMAWQTFEGHRLARLKWPVTGLLTALMLGAVLQAWTAPDRSVYGLMSDIRHSWIGSIILSPFIVFAKLFLDRAHLAPLALWASIATLINLALLWAVIRLDRHTLERSLRDHARLSARWERMKQGGSFWAIERSEIPSIRKAPSLGGLGPSAWRQAIKAYRNSSKLIAVFLVGAACAGPLSLMAGFPIVSDRGMVTLFFFFGYILPRTLICDFRGDLSRMETYKTLPIPPWRICLGQLVVQVLLSYLIALTMITSIFLFEDRMTAAMAWALVVFALPLTLLVYAIENTAFLLFPAKLVPMGRADFEFLGRALIEFISKAIVILLALLLALGVGALAFTLLVPSLLLAGLASWLALTLMAGLATVVMQFAFKRFVVAEVFD